MSLSNKRFIRNSFTLFSSIWKGFATMATEDKIYKITPKIGTHNGTFHCDEALACFMLKQLPDYKYADIVRTRDPVILDSCEIVVDVGGVYNPKTNRYDHHQRDFNHTLTTVRPHLAKNKTIKLSSAGLIYAHFGLEVLSEILKQHNHILPKEGICQIYLYVYEGFVEELDAIDNGVPMYSPGKPQYRINTDLSARVHRLNPEWNEPEPESVDDIFERAMHLVGTELVERIIRAATIWWPARQIVRNSLENRYKFYESGEVVLLGEHCPWTDHLMALEDEMNLDDQIKFVVFHDKTEIWRVQAVPIQPRSFICRVFLHKKWRGIRDEELSLISGIEGSIFCHSTGFIGGHKTKEGALQMAIKSLKASQTDKE